MSGQRITVKYGTAAAWTSNNPILVVGEMGYETDTGKLKFGDGSTVWSGLSYFAGTGLASLVEDLTPQLGGDLDANGNTITNLDASLTAKGIIEIATAAETTTGTDATRAVSPDGLAGSDFGKRVLSFGVVESDTAVEVAQGLLGIPVTAELNGYNIVGVQANVYTKGVTGTTDVQIRRQRGATDSDVLSTKVTIGDEYYAADGVIDTANDDLATGDMLFIDVDAIHTGTAPNGLSIAITVQLP